jgi:predicted anti-sigma-YlaC factor YlaD
MVYLIMRRALFAGVLLLSGLNTGCSLKTIAMRSLADTVAEPGGVYSRDEDPELVRDALPVMLKIMEQLADGLPDHKGIHLALARSFTSYGVAFLEEDGDRAQEKDVERGRVLYLRGKKMCLRAYQYGVKGLDLSAPGFARAFAGSSRQERERVLKLVKKEDVALLYWTGAALGSAIYMGKDDMKLVGDLPMVEMLMRRALELDEAWDEGSIHEFFVTYDGSRSAAQGGGAKRAREHLDRALALGKNKKLSPLVSYAEAVTIDAQDKKEFTRLLQKVAEFDVDSDPDHRLVNIIAQRRAKWLLSRISDLFAE